MSRFMEGKYVLNFRVENEGLESIDQLWKLLGGPSEDADSAGDTKE